MNDFEENLEGDHMQSYENFSAYPSELLNNKPSAIYKIYFLSLGCDKNRVDSENMLHYLVAAKDIGNVWTADGSKKSFDLRLTDQPEEADIIIVNTCSFIESAKTESIDAILELAEFKKTGKCKLLAVAGCMSWRYGREMFKDMSEIDIIFADHSLFYIKSFIATFLENLYLGKPTKRVLHIGDRDSRFHEQERYLTTPNHYAYLKIAEGCDNNCTYCAIPSIRGKYRSFKIEQLVAEANSLLDKYDVTELNIVAQDITRYGIDIYNEYSLIKLLKILSEFDFLRIRLLYCYPELLTDELINFVSENPKMCKYFDIPMQHISDRILKKMGRRVNGEQIRTLIKKIRAVNPNIVIRSTFIAGFPGETQEDFNELCEFIEEYKLDYAGFFAYSEEEGTAAVNLPDKLPENVKIERREKLYEIQSRIMEQNAVAKIGTITNVLLEGVDTERGMFYGRTEGQAPSVDPVVYLKSEKPLEAGAMYVVKIVATEGFDLIGEVQ